MHSPFPSFGEAAEERLEGLLDHRPGHLQLEDGHSHHQEHPHHDNEHGHVLYGVDVLETKCTQCGHARLPEALERRFPGAPEIVVVKNGDRGPGVGVVGGIYVEYPAVVGGHEGFGDDEPTGEASDGREDGAESVCLLWVEDCEQDEEGEPALVHEEEREEDNHVHHHRVVLVHEHEHQSGTRRQREGADGGHADKHLEDEFVGTGYSVRVLEAEEFERLDEEGHDDGAHEEGAGAAEETGDRHDLDRSAGVEVGGACWVEREREREREERIIKDSD